MKFLKSIQAFADWLRGIVVAEPVSVRVVLTEGEHDVVVVFPLTCRLTAAEIGSVEEQLAAAARGGRTRFVLDLRQVAYIDGAAMAMLVRVLRQHRAAGGDLKLADIQPPVQMLMEVMRAHRIFDVIEDVDRAIAAFIPEDATLPAHRTFHLVG